MDPTTLEGATREPQPPAVDNHRGACHGCCPLEIQSQDLRGAAPEPPAALGDLSGDGCGGWLGGSPRVGGAAKRGDPPSRGEMWAGSRLRRNGVSTSCLRASARPAATVRRAADQRLDPSLPYSDTRVQLLGRPPDPPRAVLSSFPALAPRTLPRRICLGGRSPCPRGDPPPNRDVLSATGTVLLPQPTTQAGLPTPILLPVTTIAAAQTRHRNRPGRPPCTRARE